MNDHGRNIAFLAEGQMKDKRKEYGRNSFVFKFGVCARLKHYKPRD